MTDQTNDAIINELLIKATALAQSGHLDMAQSILEQANKSFPNNKKIMLLIAHIILIANNSSLEKIQNRFKMLASVDIENARQKLSQSVQGIGNVMHTMQVLSSPRNTEHGNLAAAMLKNLYNTLVLFGETCIHLADPELANKYFDQAIALFDLQPEAYFGRGFLAYQCCDYAKAVDHFHESLRRRNFSPFLDIKRCYIVGYGSSGTMFLYKCILSMFKKYKLFYCPEQEILHAITYNFMTIDSGFVLSSTDYVQNSCDKQLVTLPLDHLVPFISCGWTHTTPDHYKDSKFYQDTRFIYVHRDGRDVVASILTAFSISEKGDNDEIASHMPGHFGCKTADMAYCLSEMLPRAYQWLDNVMSFYIHRQHFLEVRFADMTSDNPGKEKQIGVIEKMGQFMGIDLDPTAILGDVLASQAKHHGSTSYRRGYRKIGRHLELFGMEEIQLCNAVMGMGLVLFDYLSLEEFCPTLARHDSLVLVFDPDEQVMRGWAELFFQAMDKQVSFATLDQETVWQPDRQHLIFSLKPVPIPDHVAAEYFPFYSLLNYNPSLFDLKNKKRLFLRDLGQGEIIVLSNTGLADSASNRDLMTSSMEAIWLRLLDQAGIRYQVYPHYPCDAMGDPRPVVVIGHPVAENHRMVETLKNWPHTDIYSTFPLHWT